MAFETCNPQKTPGGEHALKGCALAYSNGCVGGLRLPEEGHVLAPWVAITFEGTGSVITVSNESSPATNPKHVACIKSFEFGYSDGLTLRATIHDEQGGSFEQFMHNMLKNYACLRDGSPANVRLKFQFGWVKSGCPNSVPMASSRCYYCLADSVESNFTGGKFIFDITGKDLCHRMFEGGSETIYGGDGDKAISLTEAIRKFMTEGGAPNCRSVRFCKMEGGTCRPVEFKEGGINGPKGKWLANGQDKLRVCMRWLEGHLSKDDRSFIPQYNSEDPGGELIFWEDRKPKTVQGDDYWNQNCIGTYVVGGGKTSPVIEFNPKIRWDFGRLTSVGGNLSSETANAMGTEGSKNPGLDVAGLNREENPSAGQNVQTTPTETHKSLFGKFATRIAAAANNESARALKILHDNIEADLVIVGDPTILPPSEAMWAKNLTIVLINPFHLTVSGNISCGEWISNPECNATLSNKGWICKSISHRIEAGNFTTTIGVYLTAPGVDLPPGSPIGGWVNGWKPNSNC